MRQSELKARAASHNATYVESVPFSLHFKTFRFDVSGSTQPLRANLLARCCTPPLRTSTSQVTSIHARAPVFRYPFIPLSTIPSMK